MFKNLSGFWPVYKVYIENLMPLIGEYDWAVERVFELRKIEGGFWFISPLTIHKRILIRHPP